MVYYDYNTASSTPDIHSVLALATIKWVPRLEAQRDKLVTLAENTTPT